MDGDGEAGDAFGEPCIWMLGFFLGGLCEGRDVHMSKKGPPFDAVQAIFPAEAYASRY